MERPSSGVGVVRVLVLVVLFSAAGFVESIQQHSLNSITNGDFWWHLQVGTEIVQSHALPHTGGFSQFASQPWTATSWLYDIVVAIGYRLFDLNVAAWNAIAFKAALAVVTFLLGGGLRGRFWAAVSLSAIAQYILYRFPPLPVYCSMLLFAIELILLFQSRRTESVRPLYWLPPLFLLWVNLDAGFVGGIIVLVLFVTVVAMERFRIVIPSEERNDESRACPERAKRAEGDLHFSPPLLAITAACLIATVLTPYGWSSFGVFFARLTSAANGYFPGYTSLRFRSPQDYFLLLLVMSAFLALGIRRSRDLFQITLLLLCAFASFRSQRDVWLATLAAIAVIANSSSQAHDSVAKPEEETKQLRVLRASVVIIAVTATCILLLVAGSLHLPHGHRAMLAEIGEGYPVAAANYIREHNLPQPLFNPLPWGGFLAWYLPEYPVAIDGRTDLYGDDFNIQYGKVMNAETHFSTLPAFGRAATVLLEKDSLLGKALPSVPAFKVAYSDNVAVVLTREPSSP